MPPPLSGPCHGAPRVRGRPHPAGRRSGAAGCGPRKRSATLPRSPPEVRISHLEVVGPEGPEAGSPSEPAPAGEAREKRRRGRRGGRGRRRPSGRAPAASGDGAPPVATSDAPPPAAAQRAPRPRSAERAALRAEPAPTAPAGDAFGFDADEPAPVAAAEPAAEPTGAPGDDGEPRRRRRRRGGRGRRRRDGPEDAGAPDVPVDVPVAAAPPRAEPATAD